jgi:hypothetical protein
MKDMNLIQNRVQCVNQNPSEATTVDRARSERIMQNRITELGPKGGGNKKRKTTRIPFGSRTEVETGHFCNHALNTKLNLNDVQQNRGREIRVGLGLLACVSRTEHPLPTTERF